MAIGRDAGYFRVGVENQGFSMMRPRFDFLQFTIRAEAESKDAGARLRGDMHVQRIRAVRQLQGITVRSAKPIPGFADAPEIAVVVFAAGKKKIPAVRRPLTGGLRGQRSSADKNRMQTGAKPEPSAAISQPVGVPSSGLSMLKRIVSPSGDQAGKCEAPGHAPTRGA